MVRSFVRNGRTHYGTNSSRERQDHARRQVERKNRTIRDATVKQSHYDSHDQLRTQIADFPAAYNFARRLKTPGGLKPYEYICKI
jgi:hypothetical protein